NAVNGVINIITKSAKDTDGVLGSVGGGSEERGFGSLRYGEKVENGAWRVYSKYFNRGDSRDPDGSSAYDATEAVRGGFRGDFDFSEDDKVTIIGDIFSTNEKNEYAVPSTMPPYTTPVKYPADINGGSILGRLERKLSDTSALTLQTYFSSMRRTDALGHMAVDTYDVEAQHDLTVYEHHSVSWGLGYRGIDDEFSAPSDLFSGSPENQSYGVGSLFLQDDISLAEDVRLVLGTKYSYNDFSKSELQPSGRLIWSFSERGSVWAAVSRAVRTPTRSEHNFSGLLTVTPIPMVGVSENQLGPNRGFESEELIAYEAGLRFSPISKMSIDLASFYFDYDKLVTARSGAPIFATDEGGPSITVPLVLDNGLQGHSYGGEISVNYQATPRWRMQANYSLLLMDIEGVPGFTVSNGEDYEDRDNPQHQVSFRSLLELPWDLELDALWRYQDSIENTGTDAYTELDLRLGWNISDQLTVALMGTNLLDADHNEIIDTYPTVVPANYQRAVYGKLTFKFN
ncbi:MAG: TonB-dependent receptor, partial [Bdellovibrionales bacterium]|nr:TonB-dependent receptor [Bdellovibrionales bacterium]